MKKMRDSTLILVGIALALFLAFSHLELTLVLVGAILISALIKRMCGPMVGSL